MAIPPNPIGNDVFNVAQIAEETAQQGRSLLGVEVSGFFKGRQKTRITLDPFDHNPAFSKIAIEVIPKGQERVVIDDLRTSVIKKHFWVPLKIHDNSKNEDRTVLVNINSLTSRLGVSEKVALELAAKGDDGSGLAHILNNMVNIKNAIKTEISTYESEVKEAADKAEEPPPVKVFTFSKDKTTQAVQILKTVNLIEEKRKDWAAAAAAQQKQTQSFRDFGRSVKVEIEPQKKDKITVEFFNDHVIGIPLFELGRGFSKAFDASFFYDKNQTLATSRMVNFSESDKFKHEALRNAIFSKIPGGVKTHTFSEMSVEGDQVKYVETRIAQERYKGELLNKMNLTTKELNNSFGTISGYLAGMHAMNYVHRDIKPNNIYYNVHLDGADKGKISDVAVGDLGFCVGENDTDEDIQGICGTDPYVSPEIYDGEKNKKLPNIDTWKKNDVWALGCVFYEKLLDKNTFWTLHYGMALDALIAENEKGHAKRSKQEIRELARKDLAEYMQKLFTDTDVQREFKGTLLEAIDQKVPSLDPEYKLKYTQLLFGMLEPDPNKRMTMQQVNDAFKELNIA